MPFDVAVDEFQHICYAHPDLTPKERTNQWHLLEEKYMPWRRYENDPFMERGGYWYHKLHIYLYPFYYINYTFTTMGTMEFKKKYAEDKENAWQDYLNLCKTGGSRSCLETLRYASLSTPLRQVLSPASAATRRISCSSRSQNRRNNCYPCASSRGMVRTLEYLCLPGRETVCSAQRILKELLEEDLKKVSNRERSAIPI